MVPHRRAAPLALCACVLLLAACGSKPGITGDELLARFRAETGGARLVSEGGDEDETTFAVAPGDRRRVARTYGTFAVLLFEEKHEADEFVDGAWNRDARGWSYQTRYRNIGLVWSAGARRATDERWRRLDALMERVASGESSG